MLDASRGPAWPRWFAGGTVNLTHNCVDRHALATRRIGRRWCGRARTAGQSVTYAELGAEVNRLANALLELGVGHGDAVGLYLPMSIAGGGGLLRDRQDRRDRRADLLRVRRPGGGAPGWPTPARSRVLTADAVPRQGRPVAMKAIVDEARGAGARGARGRGVVAARHRPAHARRAATTGWDELVPAPEPLRSRPRRSIPRRR